MKTLSPLILFFFLSACNQDSVASAKEKVLKKKQEISSYENKKVTLVEYFDNGRMASVRVVLDSLILPENTEITAKTFTFHRNGNLKSVGFQGLYNGIGVPVFKEKKYNDKGEKTQEIIYHNDVFGKDFIIFNYFKNDSIYLTQKFNNYILYETEKKEFGK